MFHRILVAIDSEQTIANQVLADAMATAQASGATLNLVQVLPPLSSAYPSAIPVPLDGGFNTVNAEAIATYVRLWQEREKEIQTRLQMLAAEAQAAGIAAEVTSVMGEPGREICAIAEAWNADLIVLGRRGLGGLEQMLLGSVSSYVMHRAPCSVLIVQGDQPAQP